MKQTSQQTLSTFAISIIANKFTSLEPYALESFFFFLTKFGFKDNDQNKFDGLILGHMTSSKKKNYSLARTIEKWNVPIMRHGQHIFMKQFIGQMGSHMHKKSLFSNYDQKKCRWNSSNLRETIERKVFELNAIWHQLFVYRSTFALFQFSLCI